MARCAKSRVKVMSKLGIHARPAAYLVKTAQRFKSEIHISSGRRMANARSVMEVLMLGAECGHILEVYAKGPDAVEAMQAMEHAFYRVR